MANILEISMSRFLSRLRCGALWLIAPLVVGLGSPLFGADPVKPTGPAKTINYEDHVAPILKRHCVQCHGESKQEAGLNLANHESILKGGSGGAVVIASRSGASNLFKAITAPDPEARMPPNNDPLSKEQVDLIKTWIDTGLRKNSGSAVAAAVSMTFTPTPLSQRKGPAPLPGKLPGLEKAKTNRPFPVLALAASPGAPLFAAASYEAIDFRNSTNRELIGSVPFPEGEPHVLRFSPSGMVLLAAGGRPVQNGNAALYDVKSGNRLAKFGNEPDVVLTADISPDETRVALGGPGRTIKVHSTRDGTVIQNLVKHTDWITAIAYSPDGKILATGDRVGNIHLWDAASGGVLLPLSEHKSAIRALSWRSDSQVLVSCGEDGSIIWWDVQKGWPTISKPDAHPPQRLAGVYGKIANGVLDAAFGPKGELATCGRDRTIRVWSVEGQLLKTFSLDQENAKAKPTGIPLLPTRVAITFDGSTLIAGDSEGRIHSWPLAGPK